MAIDVVIPASGESITSANVAQWHKASGDTVQKGEVLVTLETDKVSQEVEADAGGVLTILVNEGEEVEIGAVIGRIEESGSASKAEPEPEPADPQAAAATDEADEPKPEAEQPEAAASSSDSAPTGEVVKITVPAAGESITSANVGQWHKEDGDTVFKGEIIVTLETDKVSTEIEAEAAGSLTITVPEGEEVEIGTEIGTIAVGGGSSSTAEPSQPEQKSEEPAPTSQKADPVPAKPVAKATPSAASPAPVAKPDFSLTPAKDDSASAPEESDGRTTRKKMSMMRRKIAQHLVNAQQTAAILTTFNEVDMSAIMKLRKDVQEDFIAKHGVKLGFMSFFVKATVQALKDVPSINGTIEGNEVIQNHFYDVGVAIGTEKGLIVPVLRDCDKKSFAEIEQEIIDYAMKAKEGKIGIEDLQGGVFTISNGGVYGSLLSTPILNPPQSGILGMHTIQQRPVAENGEVVVRPMMYLAMSYDHRLVDGKEAVTFLIRIKDCIENPSRLLLEM